MKKRQTLVIHTKKNQNEKTHEPRPTNHQHNKLRTQTTNTTNALPNQNIHQKIPIRHNNKSIPKNPRRNRRLQLPSQSIQQEILPTRRNRQIPLNTIHRRRSNRLTSLLRIPDDKRMDNSNRKNMRARK